jgi:hypothetical protein
LKTKRTYNLSTEAIATVKRLVQEQHAAPSQDALVESAIRLFDRHIRDLEDQRRWEEAAADAQFQTEQAQIWAEFADQDRAAFEQ